MRAIDADAFIAEEKKLYCEDCDSYHGVRCRACSFNDIWGDLDDYADAYAVEVPRWILVTERLPEPETEVFVCNSNEWMTIAKLVEHHNWYDGSVVKLWVDTGDYLNYTLSCFTHWMSLPELPKDGDT